jgi:hypothetical protein
MNTLASAAEMGLIVAWAGAAGSLVFFLYHLWRFRRLMPPSSTPLTDDDSIKRFVGFRSRLDGTPVARAHLREALLDISVCLGFVFVATLFRLMG